ncbi:MAG: hypothetical protein MJ211_07625 [Bacteroidales bacterium]|nr:hypothetical protein [Bacteroidales bacterium]
MKKILLSLSLFMFTFNIFAQDKKMAKIAELYTNQQYEACIESAKKYNSSNNTNPEGFYYLGFSYFNQYKNTQKETTLKLAENTIYQAINKDKNNEKQEKFSSILAEMHDTILTIQNKYYGNNEKDKARDHASMLAKIYKDTTEIYLRIFNPEKFITPIAIGKRLSDYEGPTNQLDLSGKRQGVWIEKYENGNRKSQINFENDIPHGDFYKFYEKTGGVSAHLYCINKEVASAILYAENGDKIAMGYYYNHKKDSLWQYFTSDSLLIAEENYKNGVKNGLETTYFIFGFPLEEINWKDGVKHGTWKRYYESSTPIFETTYENGKLNGRYNKYDIKGKIIITGAYKNGLPDGEWKYYDEEKKDYVTHKYTNGKLDEKIEEEQSKKLKELINPKNLLPDPQDYINDPMEYDWK